MTTPKTLIGKISRLALAAVMVAGTMAAMPVNSDSPLAGLSREDALRLAQPTSDTGSVGASVTNMSVLSGNTYQG